MAFYWSEQQWRHELEQAGFGNVEITPHLERSVIQRWETIANLTSGLLYKLHGGKQPMEIQRKYGMRKQGQRTPRMLTSVIASAIAFRSRRTWPMPWRSGYVRPACCSVRRGTQC